jgi:hypothetical protein
VASWYWIATYLDLGIIIYQVKLRTLGTGGMHVSEIIIMNRIVVCAISAMERVAKRSCMVDGSWREQVTSEKQEEAGRQCV